MLFESDHYWLRNANVPASLIVGGSKWTPRKPPVDNLLTVDIEIQDGLISTIMAAGTFTSLSAPSIDLKGGIVWACFVELHTHLDKGHTEGRSPNPDGSFRLPRPLAAPTNCNSVHTPPSLYSDVEWRLLPLNVNI